VSIVRFKDLVLGEVVAQRVRPSIRWRVTEIDRESRQVKLEALDDVFVWEWETEESFDLGIWGRCR
jgi:hypothetical protein